MVSSRWKMIVAAGMSLAAVGACNAVLGIDSATLGDIDASTKPNNDSGSGTGDDGGGSDSGGNPGTDSGGGGTDAGKDASDSGVIDTSCAAYCAAITANCTGANAEYLTEDICNVMCPKFDLGQPGDTSGNSRACRVTYATAAAGDPTLCRAAGPLGYPNCTTAPCEPFCALDIALCAGVAYDGGEVGCITACQDPDAGFPLRLDAGDIALSNTNTLNCRVYHLESAYDPSTVGAQTTHCPHTAVISGPCQ